MSTTVETKNKAEPIPEKRPGRSPALKWLESGGLVLFTVVLGIFWTIHPDTGGAFLTLANLRVVLLSQSVLLIVTMGVLIPLLCRQYDFSAGAVAGVSSLITALSLAQGQPLVVAIVFALVFALFIGLINGLLVTLVGVDSVIVTLAMTTLLAGVAIWLTGGESIVSGIPDALLNVSNPILGAIPISFVIALGMTIVCASLLKNSPAGRYVHAIGDNPNAARLVGLPTKRLTVATFLMSSFYAGIGGVILLGVTGAGNPRVGPELTLPAIAAVFLSVAAIRPGIFNVWGAFVAIIFLAVLNSGLSLIGVDSYVNDFANGAALIVGVSLSALIRRRKRE